MKLLIVFGVVLLFAQAMPCSGGMYWDPDDVPDGTITEKDFTLPFGSPQIPADAPTPVPIFGDYSPSIDVESPTVGAPGVRQTTPQPTESRGREPRRRSDRSRTPSPPETATPDKGEMTIDRTSEPAKAMEAAPNVTPSSIIPPFHRSEKESSSTITGTTNLLPSEPKTDSPPPGPRRFGVQPLESEQPTESKPQKFRWGVDR